MKIKTLVFLLLLAPMALAQPQPKDRVIAIVDEGVILKSELDQRLNNVMQQFEGRDLPPGVTEEQIQQQVLDQLIIETIQLQMAERSGIRLDDNSLNQAMAEIAQQSNMDFESFRQMLQQEGVYNQTREQIAREIIINQFQNRAVNGRIDITDQEIQNFLRSEEGASTIAPEYRVAHILIPSNGDQLTENSRRYELGEELYSRINDGADIVELAESGTISGMTVNGGELAWNKPENLPSLFRDVVPDMQPGQVAEPFISPSGVHLVQLLETRGGTQMEVKQTHLRHIMISPNQVRTDEQAEQLIHELRQRIVDGEDFGTVARQNTDDYSSIVSGGDLEWVSEGQLPPDYMAVVNALEIGELSEPFRSEDGWHIVEVLDRRERDMTEENKRYRAEQILRNRKFEIERENWLTELRDTTYVNVLVEPGELAQNDNPQ